MKKTENGRSYILAGNMEELEREYKYTYNVIAKLEKQFHLALYVTPLIVRI